MYLVWANTNAFRKYLDWFDRQILSVAEEYLCYRMKREKKKYNIKVIDVILYRNTKMTNKFDSNVELYIDLISYFEN